MPISSNCLMVRGPVLSVTKAKSTGVMTILPALASVPDLALRIFSTSVFPIAYKYSRNWGSCHLWRARAGQTPERTAVWFLVCLINVLYV